MKSIMLSLNFVVLASLVIVAGSFVVYLSGPETKFVPEVHTKSLSSESGIVIPAFGAQYSGPYYVQGSRALVVEWSADAAVNVYIMNEADWAYKLFGRPTRSRTLSYGSSGSLRYNLTYPETLYVQIMNPVRAPVKLYSWREKLFWTEWVSIIDYERQPHSLLTAALATFTLVASLYTEFIIKSSDQTKDIKDSAYKKSLIPDRIACQNCGRVLSIYYIFCPNCMAEVESNYSSHEAIREEDIRAVPWGAKQAFLVLLSSLAFGLICESVVFSLPIGAPIRQISMEIVSVALPLFYVFRRGLDLGILGLDSERATSEFAVALLALPLIMLLGFSSFEIARVVIPIWPGWQEILETLRPTSFEDFILSLLVMTVFVAPCEEILFRGFIQRGLESGLGDVTGLILSSFLFGISHLNLWQFPQAFANGILIGYLFRKRKHRLWCPIALHAFYNSCWIIISYALLT